MEWESNGVGGRKKHTKIWVTVGRERKEKWGEGGEKTDLRVHQENKEG